MDERSHTAENGRGTDFTRALPSFLHEAMAAKYCLKRTKKTRLHESQAYPVR